MSECEMTLNSSIFFSLVFQLKHTNTSSSRLVSQVSLFASVFQVLSTLFCRNLRMKVSLWKRVKSFPSTLCRRHLKNTTTIGQFWNCVWGKLGRKISWLWRRHPFWKAGVFKFLRFFRAFSKNSVLIRGVSLYGRPNHKCKGAFLNSSYVARMKPQMMFRGRGQR